jgi:photosystem II stability/assembly factor-like uncharacterized protein
VWVLGADASWSPVGLRGTRVYSFYDGDDGRVFAGTLGSGLHRRDGAHDDWQRIGRGVVPDLAFDVSRSSRSGHLLVATGSIVGGIKTGRIFRSVDGGHSWEPTEHEPITVYRLVESSSGALFAGAQGSVILCSADGGASWESRRPMGASGSKMYSLSIDRRDRLYLGTGAQLLRSDDGAESWYDIGTGLDGLTTYGLAAGDDGVLLAATSSGMYRSVDDAASWSVCSILR